MALFRGLFGPPKPRDPVAAARVKLWVRQSLVEIPAQQEEIGVTVSEIICTDPACPGTETVILILRQHQSTQALKFSKPMDRIEESEIRHALAKNG